MRRPTLRRLIPTMLLAAAGCAGAPPPRTVVYPPRAEASAVDGVASGSETASQTGNPQSAVTTETPRTVAIPRGPLVETLDLGLGRFLGTVRVAAVLERGAFVGFRIVSFRDPAGVYEGVDLLPGDVVVRVNGSSIERPEQALTVWNGLRVTSELCVEYVRAGQRREIRLPIVD